MSWHIFIMVRLCSVSCYWCRESPWNPFLSPVKTVLFSVCEYQKINFMCFSFMFDTTLKYCAANNSIKMIVSFIYKVFDRIRDKRNETCLHVKETKRQISRSERLCWTWHFLYDPPVFTAVVLPLWIIGRLSGETGRLFSSGGLLAAGVLNTSNISGRI